MNRLFKQSAFEKDDVKKRGVLWKSVAKTLKIADGVGCVGCFHENVPCISQVDAVAGGIGYSAPDFVVLHRCWLNLTLSLCI